MLHSFGDRIILVKALMSNLRMHRMSIVNVPTLIVCNGTIMQCLSVEWKERCGSKEGEYILLMRIRVCIHYNQGEGVMCSVTSGIKSAGQA